MQGNCPCSITSAAFRQELKIWIDDLGPEKVGSIFKGSLSTHTFQLKNFREYLKTCTKWTDRMTTKLCTTLNKNVPTTQVEATVWLNI